MADRRLAAMRRVAAVRSAQRAVAQATLHIANRRGAAARDAATAAGERAEAAFATWRGQADGNRFQPDVERYFAVQLIERAGEHDAACREQDAATGATGVARQELHRAEAAVEQSGIIVARLHRADQAAREARRMADHADTVTRQWRRS